MTRQGTIVKSSIAVATRRPWLVIAIWAVAVMAMGVAGMAAKHVLKPEDLVIAGTPSADQVHRSQAAFGQSTPLMALLAGPPRELDRYGPAAVDSIKRVGGVTVSSPWSAGAPKLLRERPDRALLIVNVHKPLFDVGEHVAPEIARRLRQTLPASVESHVSGESRFSTEMFELVFRGAAKAEIVALPFLLLILLLIFRCPVAAAIPLVQGLAVIALTTGFVTLLGRVFTVNILAQASGSIIGLALGVDYSLLFVARFRDELAAGRPVHDAVAASIQTAGRTVAFAGGILAIAGLLVIATTAGWASMTTGSIGVVAAAVFSVLAAYTLLPACLTVIGENVNRWPIGRIHRDSSLAPLVRRLISRPAAASLLALVPLLFLCAHGLTLDTGGPDLKIFSPDDPVRRDIEAVAHDYGGGVMAPYQVLVESRRGPIVSPADLASLQRFQQTLAADPAVKYVIGPGTSRVRRLSDAASNGPSRLAYGLSAASIGAGQLRSGLKRGARGATVLASAGGSALAGATRLRDGLTAAAGGSSVLAGGLSQTASGSRRLDAALARLSRGAAQIRAATGAADQEARTLASSSSFLKTQLDQANTALGQIDRSGADVSGALGAAKSALDAMPASAKSDPNFQSAYASLTTAINGVSAQDAGALNDVIFKYKTVGGELEQGVRQTSNAAGDAKKLATGVNELAGGLRDVSGYTKALDAGLSRLSAGSAMLNRGIDPLRGGAAALASGLGQLSSGTNRLGGGLTSGYRRSRRLANGLRRFDSSVRRARDGGGSGSRGGRETLDLKAVGRSAYMTMALLSGVPADEKQNLQLVLNEQNGGSAARVFLFTDRFPTDKSIRFFAARLRASSARLAREMGARVSVGGQGATFLQYDDFSRSRVWPLIALMSLMSVAFLLVIFRSVLLAVKAVALNMITVGAAMGVIDLLYDGRRPTLGGPGWIEATSLFVIYSTTFALSMDYEIFMIDRMRESYLRTGSNETAIRDGVSKTASIITGSAAVMAVLFLAMALTSELISNAQMGLGLALAIVIDATVVRLVLLPATMRLFGAANWWLPGWLDRRLPRVAV